MILDSEKPVTISFEGNDVQIVIESTGSVVKITPTMESDSYSYSLCPESQSYSIGRIPTPLRVVSIDSMKDRIDMTSKMKVESQIPDSVKNVTVDRIMENRFSVVAVDGFPGRWLGVFKTFEEAYNWSIEQGLVIENRYA